MITAPIPGMIVSIKVKVGDLVKEGDVLLILEAMKMENEILAPEGGRIKEIHVKEKQSVKTREPLITIE
jgi:biotin carboxyl carrier protein